MTDNTHGAPPGRLVTDGGTEPTTVQRTAMAERVVTREVGEDGDEQEMIRVPVSSTRPDREGDRFSKEALEEMADQIAVENPMVFDNHGLAGSWMEAIPYDSRETVGAQMEAEVQSAEDGEYDLYALVNPDGTHSEGERMIRQVRDEGQPIKFSVGFRVKGYEPREDEEADYEGDGRIFTSADLMETSRVGIPANPDASVTQSMTAKDGAAGLPGYANHPFMQMMQAMGADTPQTAAPTDTDTVAVTKDVAPGADESKEDKPKCDSDSDCPDGQVCQDGHCVDESEANSTMTGETKDDDSTETKATCPECGEDVADDANYCPNCGAEMDGDGDGDEGDDDEDDEESSADVPEYVREFQKEQRELREEIAEIRDAVADGRGDAKTGPTDMDRDVTPDETDDSTDTDEQKRGSGLLG